MLTATFVVLLLDHGLPVQDVLIPLGAVSTVALALASPSAGRTAPCGSWRSRSCARVTRDQMSLRENRRAAAPPP